MSSPYFLTGGGSSGDTMIGFLMVVILMNTLMLMGMMRCTQIPGRVSIIDDDNHDDNHGNEKD